MSHHHRRAAAVSAPDPYFSSTVLLLTGNGTNGGQNNTFLDDSSNNFTITRFGNTTQGSFSPFTGAGGSGYFDGSGDYLTAGGQTAYQFGTGDFTIEFWIYFNSVSGQSNIIDLRGSAGTPAIAPVIYRLSGVIRFFTNGADRIVGSTTVTTGQWYHIALARSGTSTKLFLNGTQEGSTYTDSNSYGIGTNAPSIGSSYTTNYVNGYISSLRLIAGTAQYTSNFTPSTTPLTAITNTQLLLNFTNGSIVDATGKNDLETVGNAQISTSVKKYGTGSLAFDGTGDRLVIPYKSDLLLGSGNFTVEMWLYKNANTAYMTACGNLSTANSSAWQVLGDSTGNKIAWYSSNAFQLTSTSSLATSTWHHVAFVRNGTFFKLYLNGTEEASATNSVNFNVTNNLWIGHTPENISGRDWNGYIDDLRITKGVARYTANFTPPYRQLPTR